MCARSRRCRVRPCPERTWTVAVDRYMCLYIVTHDFETGVDFSQAAEERAVRTHIRDLLERPSSQNHRRGRRLALFVISSSPPPAVCIHRLVLAERVCLTSLQVHLLDRRSPPCMWLQERWRFRWAQAWQSRCTSPRQRSVSSPCGRESSKAARTFHSSTRALDEALLVRSPR